jgi:hypothetical protein
MGPRADGGGAGGAGGASGGMPGPDASADVGMTEGGSGGWAGNTGDAGYGGSTGGSGFEGRDGSGAPPWCNVPAPDAPVPTSTTVSDFEAGPVVQAVVPGGIWSSDTDSTGEISMTIEPCGTTGKGLHFKGSHHTAWGADVAAAMVSPPQGLDVSGYRGMSFVIRSSAPTPFLLKILSPYSQPDCGRCDDSNTIGDDDCYSGYVKALSTTADATTQFVAWSELSQQSWGYRPPGSATFDPRGLLAIVFAFLKNVDFDACIDDIKLER